MHRSTQRPQTHSRQETHTGSPAGKEHLHTVRPQTQTEQHQASEKHSQTKYTGRSRWGRQYTYTVRPLAQSDQRHGQTTDTHRVTVRQAIQVYDWAAAKYKYGIRSEICGTRESKLTHGPQAEMCAHSQATGTGHTAHHASTQPDSNPDIQSQIPSPTHVQTGMYTDYNTHSDTTRWGLGSWRSWNSSTAPCSVPQPWDL